jgi:hypothetical protein
MSTFLLLLAGGIFGGIAGLLWTYHHDFKKGGLYDRAYDFGYSIGYFDAMAQIEDNMVTELESFTAAHTSDDTEHRASRA